jgi:beta-galactosidase
VPYTPGVLSAVAYRAGQKVATSEILTAGVPARLQITPLAIPVASDLSVYEITVVDAAGLTVTDANPAVKVDVAGAGRLIGLDTGDLNYGGRFKVDTRDAYQGRLLATVQSTAPAGEIHLTVSAPKLPAATLTAFANSSSGK